MPIPPSPPSPSTRKATARSSSRRIDYPHGPITVRISGDNGLVKDNCYLQLYNKGGVSWNEGMPKDPPPAAKGMKLVFADDFNGPLSISSTDPKATYYDHKPPNGYQDFSVHVFSGHDSPEEPVRPGRFLSADQGQRQDAQLRLDFLDEERRQRHQGLGALLLRMPVHRAERHRHVAGLLAHDGLHDGLQGSRATKRRATSWTSSRPMAAKAPARPTPATRI